MSFPIISPAIGQYAVADPLQLRLLRLGAASATPSDWQYEDLTAPYWRIYVNFSAGGSIQAHGKRVMDLLPGFSYIIPPWLHYRSNCSQACEHFFAHFDLPSLRSHASSPGLQRIIKLESSVGPNPEPLARALSPQSANDVPHIASTKQWIFAQLEALWNQLTTSEKQALHAPSHDPILQQVYEFIEERLEQSLSVARLAKEAGLSQPQLTRRFRKDKGMAPAQWIRERRITRAALMLGQGHSIDDCAQVTGFADRNQFSKSFKKITGLSPGKYRDMSGSELGAQRYDSPNHK